MTEERIITLTNQMSSSNKDYVFAFRRMFKGIDPFTREAINILIEKYQYSYETASSAYIEYAMHMVTKPNKEPNGQAFVFMNALRSAMRPQGG